jgi:vancomycin permeability regulator SanA
MKKRKLFFFYGFPILLFIASLLPIFLIHKNAKEKIFLPNAVAYEDVGIVFGASVYANKYPSKVLDDRIRTAVELYKEGKISYLLMTGDNAQVDYNEVLVMKKSAIAYGVPEEKIFMDHAGFRTFDSCVRAKEVFGISSAILVTQKFHLPRAIFLCEKAGIMVSGVSAEAQYLYNSRTIFSWNIREFMAKIYAFYEASFFWHSPRYLGEKVSIGN